MVRWKGSPFSIIGLQREGAAALFNKHAPSERMKRVLVVEDLPHVLDRIVGSINGNGFDSIATAMNQQDALDVLRSLDEPPVLMITDLVFPKRGGEGTFKEN